MNQYLIAITLSALALSVAAQTPEQVAYFKKQVEIANGRLTNYSEEVSGALAVKSRPALIAQVKRNIANGLKDPDSAKFRDVTLRPFAKGHVVCGQVNAKNSYGAYVGFVPFVAGVSAVTITKGSGGVMDDLAETTILVGCS